MPVVTCGLKRSPADFGTNPATEKPLHGDLSAYAYHQRGALAYVVELWDLFKQLGFEGKKPFVDHYSKWTRKDMRTLAAFDLQHKDSRVLGPWKKAQHPQLGEVEINGFDPRVGLWNPPYERLADTCRAQSASFLRLAALAPRVSVTVVKQAKIEGHMRTELGIANHGYLAGYGIPSAKTLPHAEPLRLTARAEGARLLAPTEAVVEIGHLDGWGAGLYVARWSSGRGPAAMATSAS